MLLILNSSQQKSVSVRIVGVATELQWLRMCMLLVTCCFHCVGVGAPNGQLPILEIDGKIFGQSLACARYLARKFSKCPTTIYFLNHFLE